MLFSLFKFSWLEAESLLLLLPPAQADSIRIVINNIELNIFNLIKIPPKDDIKPCYIYSRVLQSVILKRLTKREGLN